MKRPRITLERTNTGLVPVKPGEGEVSGRGTGWGKNEISAHGEMLGIEKEVMFSTQGHPVGDWSELALIL